MGVFMCARKYVLHANGHGLGFGWEKPRFGVGQEVEGMTIALDIGFYFLDVGGMNRFCDIPEMTRVAAPCYFLPTVFDERKIFNEVSSKIISLKHF